MGSLVGFGINLNELTIEVLVVVINELAVVGS